MSKKSIRALLKTFGWETGSKREYNQDAGKFTVVAELVPLPGHNLKNIVGFLQDYSRNKNHLPDDMVLAGVTLPQSPGGVSSMNPGDIIALMDKEGLWDDLDVLPHVTAKDKNVDGITSDLVGLQKSGVESVLALTGDKPVACKKVFEIDSIGLIDLLKEMNFRSYGRARPGRFDKVHQFYIGAAVSPFKYTEASQMQQYFKLAKKLRAGADFLITQLGWDARKSEELFHYLRDIKITVPVLGNVYILTTMTPAPRLMYTGKLPGCLVTQELFETLQNETSDQHLERAAQQVAMYRDLGAAGVDVGGLLDFAMLEKVLTRAAEIGPDWRRYRQNLSFGIKDGFYLYNEDGQRRAPSRPLAPFGKKMFDFMHGSLLEPGQGLHHSLQKTLGASRSLREGKGALYKSFYTAEKTVKTLLFDCQECGDCFLVENFGICSMGRCEKGLNNAPCGDSNPDGTCGNNPDLVCVGERIYAAAASEGAVGLEKLARQINPKRNPTLEGTASILNYLLERDHTMQTKLIQIGESVHASIPKPGAAMKELLALGPGAYDTPSGPLGYIISLIESQVKHRADYIEVNVDAFGEDDPQIAVQMMRDYTRLVRRHSKGVPVCIDSSDDNVLIAGLEAWYKGAPQDIPVPLVNSVKTYTMDAILPLREKYPFKIIGLLVDNESAGTDGSYGADELHQMARVIFRAATGKYGFEPEDLFFDSTVFPLAIDMPMMPNTPGYTYRAFEAIRLIMNDPEMKGVHTSLGISNCVKDLPGRRIGVCRAYLAKAMEYGLDAAIVNVLHDYGLKPVAPDLMELVDAFARQDGSAEASQKAMDLIGQFCRANRKAAKQ